LEIVTLLMEPDTPIVPGQRTILELDRQDVDKFRDAMRANRGSNDKVHIVPLGFVEKNVENRPIRVMPVGALAELVDPTTLYTKGEVVIRLVGRMQIRKVVSATSKLVVHASLLQDEEPFKDNLPPLAEETMQIVYRLYDRCNAEEAEVKRLQSKWELADKAAKRQPLTAKVDSFLELESAVSGDRILSWVSFCAMEYHFDTQTRYWALEQVNPVMRLEVVKQGLQQRLRQLQAERKLAAIGSL